MTLVAGLSACTTEQASYQFADCNVILISIDTLRADHLGCYGWSNDTSPNLDAFSRQSVLFKTAIVQAPSTTPSHASMFTSVLPVHHGAFRGRNSAISEQLVTLPEILKQAGFRTVSYNGGGQVDATFGFDRGFDIYESLPLGERFEDTVRRSLTWLQAHDSERFFMFLHTYETHLPYEPRPEYLALFDKGNSSSLGSNLDVRLFQDVEIGAKRLDEEDLRHVNNAYDAEIRSMDEALGLFFRFLEERKLKDKTLIVFTSDHGEALGEHGAVARHTELFYDEVLKVPLIVRFPGSRFASTVVEQQVRSIDIMPTILEVLGIDSPPQAEGHSLMPLVSDKTDRGWIAIAQQDTADNTHSAAIRTGTQKLITRPFTVVDTDTFKWFKDRAELVFETSSFAIPIASFAGDSALEITVGGATHVCVIGPEKRTINMTFQVVQPRTVTIQSVTPCRKPEDHGVHLDLDCVSFRIFNPQEYYLLSEDPQELQNQFADARNKAQIQKLSKMLEMATAPRGEGPQRERIELDEKTLEKLKALGYIN